MTPGTTGRRAAVMLVLSALVAGCLDAPAPSTTPTAPPTAEPTPTTTSFNLGTTVWYEGLVIHVDGASATLDERGGPVEFRIRMENFGDDEGELDARVLFQVDSSTSDPPLEPTRESRIPTVPAHGLAGALMTYELQAIDSVDRGVLLIGEAPNHIARIPLTAEGGAPVVFEPIQLAVSGTTAINDLRLTLRSGVLRWDLPDWSEELPSNSQAITLTYDATYLGTFEGGYPFTGDNVRLQLPDRTWVVPRRDGHSQSIELIGPGKTKKDLMSRFEIPAGLTGRFALVVRTGPGASRAIPFVVEG